MSNVGGYNVLLEGRPSREAAKRTEPDVLHLPLFSRNFDFSSLRVEHGESVRQGQILAGDPVNYFVPLLAPLNGTVNLEAVERHITLENLSGTAVDFPDESNRSVDREDRRQELLRLGVWSFMTQVSTGRIADPDGIPKALVVPVARLEPFFPDPDVVLFKCVDRFVEGLRLLHNVLEGVELHLVLPQAVSERVEQVRQAVKHYEWVAVLDVTNRYPDDNPALVTRKLDYEPGSVWSVDPQAVLAAEQALTHGRPYLTRIVSVGGPAVSRPCHFRAPLGCPLHALVGRDVERQSLRIIDGGVLTGRAVEAGQEGLDAECVALTVVREHTEREVLAFVRAGFATQSFSRSFASVLRPSFRERPTTALRGEARPCVFCGYCEDVCPARLIPHVLYRYLDNGRAEDARRFGLERCVACGLCSYVCLSKIEHLRLFQQEKARQASTG